MVLSQIGQRLVSSGAGTVWMGSRDCAAMGAVLPTWGFRILRHVAFCCLFRRRFLLGQARHKVGG